jgi:hypothetical protein
MLSREAANTIVFGLAMHVSIKITKSIVNEHLTIYTQKYKPTKINETVVK